jgi:hypothetical protein
MSFVTPDSLSRLGLDPDLISPGTEYGRDLLQGFIDTAAFRLRKWVGDAAYETALRWDATHPPRIRFVMAELYLSICEALPMVWMQGQSGERSVSIEGFRVDLAAPGEEERSAILRSLLNRAESLVEEWMVGPGSGAGQDVIAV